MSTPPLRAQGKRPQGTGEVIDRRLFPWVRRRAARWTHSHLVEGLHGTYVDLSQIGDAEHTLASRAHMSPSSNAF